MPETTTSTDRVRALRERRDTAGLTRLDLYVHPLDHAAVKQLAAQLQRDRAKRAVPPVAGAARV